MTTPLLSNNDLQLQATLQHDGVYLTIPVKANAGYYLGEMIHVTLGERVYDAVITGVFYNEKRVVALEHRPNAVRLFINARGEFIQ